MAAETSRIDTGRQDGRSSALVHNQLTGTVAVLLKRGWLTDSPEERHTFFADVEHTAAASGNAGMRCSAMALLEVGHCMLAGLHLSLCLKQQYAAPG